MYRLGVPVFERELNNGLANIIPRVVLFLRRLLEVGDVGNCRGNRKREGEKKPLSSVLVAGVSYPCQSTKMRDNECLTELG